MIKIIKEGRIPPKTKTIYIIDCPKCKCKFECELSDLTIEKPNGKRTINCPCCKKEIHLIDGDFGNDNNYKTREEPVEEVKEVEEEPKKDNFEPDIPIMDPLRTGGHSYLSLNGDPCEDCINRDGPKDGLGRPTVGDSPCEWCRHYRWKATYLNRTK